MDVDTHTSSAPQWMGVIGFLLVFMGLYGAIRMTHISVRGVPYPSRGVFPNTVLFQGDSVSYGREGDCDPYPQVYYDYGPDGKQTSRPATNEELGVQQEQSKRCVNGFNEDRSKQRQYDKNQAAFLIFVGTGLLFARRFFS